MMNNSNIIVISITLTITQLEYFQNQNTPQNKNTLILS